MTGARRLAPIPAADVGSRRVYQAAGFRVVSEEPHHSFDHDLVGQTWTLDLG
jgi:hypothetical protein